MHQHKVSHRGTYLLEEHGFVGNMALAFLLYSQEVGRGHRGLEMLLSSCERDTLTVDLPETRERERLIYASSYFPRRLYQ